MSETILPQSTGEINAERSRVKREIYAFVSRMDLREAQNLLDDLRSSSQEDVIVPTLQDDEEAFLDYQFDNKVNP